MFSLPVGATKARLGTCQEEVNFCLQALLRNGSSHGEGNSSRGNLVQLGKHNMWEHSLFSSMARVQGVCEARPNYPSVHLSPQMSCALTIPIALSTPRRSASQCRCCFWMRACRNKTRSSPLSGQLPHFQETPDCFRPIYPTLPPEIAQ